MKVRYPKADFSDIEDFAIEGTWKDLASKSQIPKVMFLAATARPRREHNFDGLIQSSIGRHNFYASSGSGYGTYYVISIRNILRMPIYTGLYYYFKIII